jgi:hypothetical protein
VAVPVDEDEVPNLAGPGAQRLGLALAIERAHRRREFLGHVDGADGVGLGGAELAAGKSALDQDLTPAEIEVPPLQRKGLAWPGAGSCEQQE